MASTLMFLLTLFRDFGFSTAAIQACQLTEGQQTALLHLHAALGAVLALLTFALAIPVAKFYQEPQVAPLLQLMGLGFAINGLGAWPRTWLSRHLHFREINRLETAGAAAGTLAMITAGVTGAGAYSFAWFLLVSEAIMTASAWYWCDWRPKTHPEWASLRSLAATALELTGYNLLLYCLQQVDSMLMGRWFGAVSLGLYNRAGQLLMQPTTHLAAPFAQVLLSTLARLDSDSADFPRHFRQTTNLIAHCTLPIAVACLLLPHDIITVVLGRSWPEAAPLLRWIAVSAAASYLSSTMFPLCVATGHSRRLLWLSALTLGVTLMALWFGRPYGPIGLAAALGITNIVLLLPRLWWSAGGTPVALRDFMQAFKMPLLASLLQSAGMALARDVLAETSASLRLLGSVGAGFGLVAMLALFWPAFRVEYRLIWSHLPLSRTNRAT